MTIRRALLKQSAALDLADLRAGIAALDATELDPVDRARQSTRIAYTAVAVAFTQGVITREVAERLIGALEAVLAGLEDA